jgi:hypothetical protein
LPDEDSKAAEYARFVADLCRIRRMMAGEAVDSSRRVENA